MGCSGAFTPNSGVLGCIFGAFTFSILFNRRVAQITVLANCCTDGHAGMHLGLTEEVFPR